MVIFLKYFCERFYTFKVSVKVSITNKQVSFCHILYDVLIKINALYITRHALGDIEQLSIKPPF